MAIQRRKSLNDLSDQYKRISDGLQERVDNGKMKEKAALKRADRAGMAWLRYNRRIYEGRQYKDDLNNVSKDYARERKYSRSQYMGLSAK